MPALVAAGMRRVDPAMRRAVDWLDRHQNDDGGWGEDLRSYRDPLAGPGRLHRLPDGLGAAGPARRRRASASARSGACAWLVDTQRPDGTWDEPWFTGTGFPGDFYINYHLYRLVFPVMALGPVRQRAVIGG